uniref:Uncharacterized protein n=1 Tax=Arundo donax TaxID=35708 RepID=A0A0A9GCU0_ARUDO
MTSFPAAFALKGLAKLPHFEHTLAAHVDCKLAPRGPRGDASSRRRTARMRRDATMDG